MDTINSWLKMLSNYDERKAKLSIYWFEQLLKTDIVSEQKAIVKNLKALINGIRPYEVIKGKASY